MHTANNSYIEILKQSLTKKIELLDTIMALNVLQKDMLENPDLDPDELEENLNRKADLVEQLSKLDDGFSQIYDRVRADLTENRGAYSEDIAQMKRDITAIMDKSTAIQSQEKRNQVLMQQKFTSVKKQIKEVKKSRQADEFLLQKYDENGNSRVPHFWMIRSRLEKFKKIFHLL